MPAGSHPHVGEANATTFESEPPSKQLDRASVVVEGAVKSIRYEIVDADGEDFPVTWYLLDISETLLGEVTSGEIFLGVPGGPHGESWVHITDAPELDIGEHVLVVGTKSRDNAVRLTGWTQSLFVQRDVGTKIARDSAADAVGGLTCGEAPWVVLPLSDAPSTLFDGASMTLAEAQSMQEGPIFVENPDEDAMTWSALLDTHRTCIASSPNAGVILPGYVEGEVAR